MLETEPEGLVLGPFDGPEEGLELTLPLGVNDG